VFLLSGKEFGFDKELGEFISRVQAVFFFPLQIVISSRRDYINTFFDELTRTFQAEYETNKQAPYFYFSKRYLQSIIRLCVKNVTIKFRFNYQGKEVEATVKTLVCIEFFRGFKITIDIGDCRKIFIPAVAYILVTDMATSDPNALVPMLVILPHYVMSSLKKCYVLVDCEELIFVDYLESLIRDALGRIIKRLQGPLSINVKLLDERTRSHGLAIMLKPDIIGNVDVTKFILNFCKEFYGLATGDEGYSQVIPEYARTKLTKWLRTTRLYMGKILSPYSMILVEKDIERLSVEEIKLPLCETWMAYMRQHELNVPPIYRHNTFFVIEYVSIADAVIELFRSAINFSISQIRTLLKSAGVSTLESTLVKLIKLRTELTMLVNMIAPENVVLIPEAAQYLESIYQAKRLKMFRDTLTEIIDSIVGEVTDISEILRSTIQKRQEVILSILLMAMSIIPIKELVGVIMNIRLKPVIDVISSIAILVFILIIYPLTGRYYEKRELSKYLEIWRR